MLRVFRQHTDQHIISAVRRNFGETVVTRLLSALIIWIALLLIVRMVAAGPLHEAVEQGNLGLVEQAIAAGEDLNVEDFMLGMPLHIAARSGNTGIAELLIQSGADVRAEDSVGTPMDAAISTGQTELVELLLSNGVGGTDLNSAGNAPLHVAA